MRHLERLSHTNWTHRIAWQPTIVISMIIKCWCQCSFVCPTHCCQSTNGFLLFRWSEKKKIRDSWERTCYNFIFVKPNNKNGILYFICIWCFYFAFSSILMLLYFIKIICFCELGSKCRRVLYHWEIWMDMIVI